MHLIVYGGNAILLRMASPATALQVAGGGDQAPYDMVDKLLQARSRGCSPLPLQNSWCVVSTDSSVDKRWEKDKATNVAARLQCCRSHRRSNFASSVLSQLRTRRLHSSRSALSSCTFATCAGTSSLSPGVTGVPGACWWLMVAVPFTVNGMKQLLQLRDTKGIVYIYIYINMFP